MQENQAWQRWVTWRGAPRMGIPQSAHGHLWVRFMFLKAELPLVQRNSNSPKNISVEIKRLYRIITKRCETHQLFAPLSQFERADPRHVNLIKNNRDHCGADGPAGLTQAAHRFLLPG